MHLRDWLIGIDCPQPRAAQQENDQEPDESMRMGNPRLAWHDCHARYILHSDTLCIPKIRTYNYPDSVFRGERMLPIIKWVKRAKSRILVFDHNMLLRE